MFKNLRLLLTYNLRSILWFEFIYKLTTIFVFLPLLAGMFFLVMQITGHPYLAPDNIGSFLINPLVWLVLLIAIIALTVYTIFDVATIIIIMNQSRQKRKINVWQATSASAHSLKNIVNRRNILLPLMVLVLLPFVSIGLAFGFNRHLALPEFIGSFIENNFTLLIIISIVILLLTILLVRWMYAFHYYVLEKMDFKSARLASRKLIKTHAVQDFILLLLVQVFYILFVGLMIFIGIAILWLINLILQNAPGVLAWLNPILMALFLLCTMMLSLMAVPCVYALLSERFYTHKKQHREKVHQLQIPKAVSFTTKQKGFAITTTLIILGVGATIYYSVGAGHYTMTTEREQPVAITAHRGFSAEYPENTMSAFRAAVENSADWIELDVQQTKDHKIVISHDDNTERMAGVDKDIWDTDYAELATLDFDGDRIATLEEVLDLANKSGVRLNIEIKRNGHDDGIEAATIKLIRAYHQEKKCMVASLSYDTLQTVKSIDPEIRTLYNMLFAYGAVSQIPDVDGYSVEATSISSRLIANAQAANKPIMAWTINSADNIRRLDNMGIDNIITDNLKLAKTTIQDNTDNPYADFWSLLRYSMHL